MLQADPQTPSRADPQTPSRADPQAPSRGEPQADPGHAPDADRADPVPLTSGVDRDGRPPAGPATDPDDDHPGPGGTDLEARILQVAREAFGWEEPRPGQLAGIRSLLTGHDVLVVMPTGAGKSAIYQIAALLLAGPTVVVSPLIALQRDQVAGLRGSWAPEAVTVNSVQAAADTSHAWEALRAGDAEFVFLAPEQLAKPDVVRRLAAARPSLLVVDEAHCVSAWGHDFRPDYLRIADAVEPLGRPAVVALTATAAPPIRREIRDRLRLRDVREVVEGFDRPNLRLAVRRFREPRDQRDAVVDAVTRACTAGTGPAGAGPAGAGPAGAGPEPGCGLVYAATRRDTEECADALRERGLRALAYHGGLRSAQRRAVHEDFLASRADVVVATSAFGMGIDKADVRFVVHAAVPESIDAYYQQIGRAGRDGRPATALLAYRPEDLGLRRFFASRTLDPRLLSAVLHALRDGGHPVRTTALAEHVGVTRQRLTGALNLLERCGSLRFPRPGTPRATGDEPVDDVVTRALELAGSGERVDRSRVEMMRGYAETTGCRREYLLGYFGEAYRAPCGNCDVCDPLVPGPVGAVGMVEVVEPGGADIVTAGYAGHAGPDDPATPDDSAGSDDPARRDDPEGPDDYAGPDDSDSGGPAAEPFPANARVVHEQWGPGVVIRPEPDRVTVLFEQNGYHTLALDAVRGGLLRRTDRPAP